jgi:hypothetical protein
MAVRPSSLERSLHRSDHLRLALATLLAVAMCARASAEDNHLRDLLALLGGLKMGSSYDAVKNACPAVGSLKPDAGDDNTEAIVRATVDGVQIHGEFNFSRGALVSHGFSSGTLTHSQAHDFFIRCASEAIELYGDGEREVVLPSEHDGPAGEIDVQLNWHKEGVSFQLSLAYNKAEARVSWGVQGESPR